MNSIELGENPAVQNRRFRASAFLFGTRPAQPVSASRIQKPYPELSTKSGPLGHTNLIADYDVGEDHDMAYIAMELLKGEDLTHFCHKGGQANQRLPARIGNLAGKCSGG